MTTLTKPGSEDRNVQTVLNAFDSLFNKRDYASAERFWSPHYIQHSAHIPPGRDGPLTWSRPCPRRCGTRTTLPRRPVISSFSMGGSAVSGQRRRGSSPTSYVWRMKFSRSTGTSSRTRLHGINRAAVCRCSATNSRTDRHRSAFLVALLVQEGARRSRRDSKADTLNAPHWHRGLGSELINLSGSTIRY
jgi:hypothetical protein